MIDKRITKKQRQQISKARRQRNNFNTRESQKYLNALQRNFEPVDEEVFVYSDF